MNSFFSRLFTVVACFFIFSAAWFCLWCVSLHLVERPELAVLLFPFGLRLGLMLQCPRGYWPVLLGAEWLLLFWLAQTSVRPWEAVQMQPSKQQTLSL